MLINRILKIHVSLSLTDGIKDKFNFNYINEDLLLEEELIKSELNYSQYE